MNSGGAKVRRLAGGSDRIAEVRERSDLLAEVVGHGGRIVRQNGDKVTLHCPAPNHEDKDPSFTVEHGRFRCWSQCAKQGDVIDLVEWLEGCNTAEAINRLAERLGIDPRSPSSRALSDVDLLTRFLRSRQWCMEVADVLDLRVVRDQFGKPRVRFPFRLRGQVVYHQDRALTPSRRRWLSSKGSTPCPYEVDRLLGAAQRGHVVLCEGVTDVAALVNAYLDPAVVGIPGVGLFRKEWVGAFEGLTVWLVADRDEAGEKMRVSVTEMLVQVACLQHVYVPEPYKDVDEWIRKAGAEPFDEAFGSQVLRQ